MTVDATLINDYFVKYRDESSSLTKKLNFTRLDLACLFSEARLMSIEGSNFVVEYCDKRRRTCLELWATCLTLLQRTDIKQGRFEIG